CGSTCRGRTGARPRQEQEGGGKRRGADGADRVTREGKRSKGGSAIGRGVRGSELSELKSERSGLKTQRRIFRSERTTFRTEPKILRTERRILKTELTILRFERRVSSSLA